MRHSHQDHFEKHYLPEPNSGCWIWTAALDRDGYGRFSIYNYDGRRMTVNFAAHRFSYELYRGKIQDGMQIDHLCRVKCCVNPDHIEVVTVLENNKRKNSLITHCPHGHSLHDAFMKKRNNGYVGRSCRECGRLYCIAYYRKKKSKVGDAP